VAETPQFLTAEHNRDDRGRLEVVLRRVFLGLLAVVLLLGLLNAFRQEEVHSTAQASAATLAVSAPTRLRGGLFFQGRFTIVPRREVAKATLVFDRGWTEGMHINTIEPAPVGESSRDGKLALDLGHVAAGARVILYMQFQVNPTNNGRRSQAVELYDDEALLARVDRTVTVFP
jgi:hypothetical protein